MPKVDIRSYQQALNFLSSPISKTSKKLGHCLYVKYTGNNTISIIYYETPIVTYFPDRLIQLNSGGWRTCSTKKHINAHIPPRFYLYQKKSIWYLTDLGLGMEIKKETVPFYEGIKISREGIQEEETKNVQIL